MSGVKKGLLTKLPPSTIVGIVDDEITFATNWVFGAKSWTGEPILHNDRTRVPVCWTPVNGYQSFSAFYDSESEYLHDAESLITPSHWGEQGTLIRAPRAIVFRFFQESVRSVARDACRQLKTELELGRIYSGAVGTGVAVSYSLVLWNLLNYGYDILIDNGDEYEVQRINEEDSIGGEVLFVIENDVITSSGGSPYWDGSNGLPNVRAHDLDVLERSRLRFAKVKYLYLQGFDSLVASSALAAVNGFAAAAPSGMVDFRHFNGGFRANLTPNSYTEALAVCKQVIREFFTL